MHSSIMNTGWTITMIMTNKINLKVRYIAGLFLIFQALSLSTVAQNKALSEYLLGKIQYTPTAVEAKTSGQVIAQVKINEKGEATKIEFIQALGAGLYESVEAAIKSVGDWNQYWSGWHAELDLRIPIQFIHRSQSNSLDSNELLVYMYDYRTNHDAHRFGSWEVLEKMPEFSKGGEDGLNEYLARKIKYPKKAIQKMVSGKIMTSFVVDSSGQIANLKLLQGIGEGCDEEALKVIREMPKWSPGIQNGRKVNVRYLLPISFTTGIPLSNFRSNSLIVLDTLKLYSHDSLFVQFPGGLNGLKDSFKAHFQFPETTENDSMDLDLKVTIESDTNFTLLAPAAEKQQIYYQAAKKALDEIKKYVIPANYRQKYIPQEFLLRLRYRKADPNSK